MELKITERGWPAHYICQDGIYWDADTFNPIDFDSEWAIHDCAEDSEFRANEMHDKVVAELSEKIKKVYGKGE